MPNESNNVKIIQPLYEYSVKSGDTLFDISERNGMPLGTLIAANPQIKNPDLIYPDDKIYIPQKSELHKGQSTYYHLEPGSCSLEPFSEQYDIVAVNRYDFNNALLCGAYIEVTNWLNTVKVLIADRMAGSKGDLDLEMKAFRKLAPLIKGRIGTTWRIIPLEFKDDNDNKLKYYFSSDSNEYYISVKIMNHLYPIKKLEYFSKKECEYIELKRRKTDGIFIKVNPKQKIFNFRVTSIYNQIIVDKNIKLSSGKTIVGNIQFQNLHCLYEEL